MLLVIGFVGYYSSRAASYKPGVIIECMNSEDRERVKSLTNQALNEAYKNQVEHLFMIWMRDSHDQPQRAQAGVSQAIVAWLGAHKGMNSFQPPECPGTK